jgi:hypothetical protein
VRWSRWPKWADRSTDRADAPVSEEAVRTVYQDGSWLNQVEGRGQGGRYPTRDLAVDAGRELARSLEADHIVHDVDGAIHKRRRHSRDP